MRIRNKDILLVPIAIISGKVLSFAFNALLGAYYGAGKISDAFILAHTIPTVLFEGIAVALITCYIPIQRSIEYKSPEKMDDYNSNMISLSLLLSLLITTIYSLFHQQINRVYAKGFDSVSLGLLNHYSSILVWSIPMIGVYSIFRGYLQVSNKKAISSLYQVIAYSALMISIVFFFPKDDMMAWATLGGNAVCLFVFGIAAVNSGFRYKLYFSLKDSYIRNMLVMIFPIFISSLAAELASIVDKYYASQFSDGIITSMTYGYQLSFSIQGIVSSSLVIVLFPTLSDKAAKGRYDEMNEAIYNGIEMIAWATLPLLIGGAVLAYPTINVLFGHGSFSQESVSITAIVFSGYLFGVFPMCVKHVGDRVCYALQKTKLALITALVTVFSNIILDKIMSRILGYMGLVFATGIAILIGTIVSLFLIKNEEHGFSIGVILLSITRPLVAAGIMGIVVFFLRNCMVSAHFSDMVVLLVCCFVGMVVYIMTAVILFRPQMARIKRYLIK